MRAPRAQLLGEARLADAGLSGDENELGAALLGRVPQLDQACPLAGTADEHAGGQRPGPLRLRQAGHEGLIGRSRRRRRRHAEVALQRRGAGVVRLERPRPVPARVVQAHQEAVGLLAERIETEQPLGVANGVAGGAFLFELGAEALEHLELGRAQAVALLEQPLVVGALEEVAAVRVGGLAQRSASDGVLVGREVEAERGVGSPAQRAGGDVEVAVGLGQRAPERVEHVAQVRAGLALRGVGPEQEGEPLPRLRRVAVDEQVREERLGARGLEGRQWRVPEPQVERAEQADGERGRHAAYRTMRNGTFAGRAALPAASTASSRSR